MEKISLEIKRGSFYKYIFLKLQLPEVEFWLFSIFYSRHTFEINLHTLKTDQNIQTFITLLLETSLCFSSRIPHYTSDL